MEIVIEKFNKIIDNFKNFFRNFIRKISNSKQIFIIITVIIAFITLIIVITKSIIIRVRNDNCYELRNKIGSYVDSYLDSNDLWPTVNGDNIIVDLNNIKKITFNDKVCSGTVKTTKVNDEYIKTFYLENCSYCSVDNFSKEKDIYDNKLNAEVVVYINYYNFTNNNSKWSDYIPFEEISTEETNGVLLPLDESDLPKVSDEAIITEIIKEDKTFYSYRDKKWLWYKVNNNDYSEFSSDQPSGYAKKDTKTEIRTEYTEWSIDYPEEKDYRVIFSKTGYRWYKTDENGNKSWWNNGAYYPEKPEEGYKKDNSSKITMYRYYDKMWRWYNGEARGYSSSQSSTAPSNSYKYKDEDITSYSNWSDYKSSSSIDSSNSYYREERINVHSRYMIKYKIRSFKVLEKDLERSKFEETVGKTLQEMSEDINIDLEITFKYRY